MSPESSSNIEPGSPESLKSTSLPPPPVTLLFAKSPPNFFSSIFAGVELITEGARSFLALFEGPSFDALLELGLEELELLSLQASAS